MANDGERLHFGQEEGGALFPASVPAASYGVPYAELIGHIKDEIQSTRLSVVLHANTEMTLLYWRVGNAIRQAQEEHGWGAKVIDRVFRDLRKAFPDMRGFSPTNLHYMRQFSEMWSEEAILQQAVGELPWGTNIVLMSKLNTTEARLWYAEEAVKNGWSRNVLAMKIESPAFSPLCDAS